MIAKPCYVYLVQSEAPAPSELWTPQRPSLSVFKVGITDSVGHRVRQLLGANAFKLRLIAKWKFPERAIAMAVEKTFHARNAHCRLNGEWFYEDLNGACCDITEIICELCVEKWRFSAETAVEFIVDCGEDAASARDIVVASYGEEAFV